MHANNNKKANLDEEFICEKTTNYIDQMWESWKKTKLFNKDDKHGKETSNTSSESKTSIK